ncbi:MAG: hypothetical protein JNM90_24975 [Burkholderiales bacterium]|nr:hypothetical protein [Burkholderiales bacterium]
MGRSGDSRLRMLVFIAALLQAALPVLAHARMAADGGLTLEVCTAAGAKKLVVGADGTARDAAPDAGHGEPCPLCTGTGGTPIAALIRLHESVRHAGRIPPGFACSAPGAAVATPPATGPPDGS